MSDKSLPDASFIAAGRTYHGIFRLPHGRWQTLCGKDGKPLIFGDAIAATRAAMAKMNAILFQPIRVQRTAEPTNPVPSFLDASLWKTERAEHAEVERREVFKGLGKGFLTVETKRRRA